jgi:hypothetical protein
MGIKQKKNCENIFQNGRLKKTEIFQTVNPQKFQGLVLELVGFIDAKGMADAHFASKNTLLKRNTLHCYILLKRTVCF